MPNKFSINCPNPDGNEGSHSIQIYEWGDKSNEDVLICVHSLTRNARDFDYLATDLQDKYRIICPDMAGRGKSDFLTDPSQYNYVTYVSDMLHVMQELGISQCKWVGTSMGGLIGIMIAANIPGIISKLVINDIGPFLSKEGLQRIGSYVGNAPEFATIDEAEEYFGIICAPWGIKDVEIIKNITNSSIIATNTGFKTNYDPAIGNVFKDENGDPKNMDDVDLWEIWEKINCPTLILRGEESDILAPDVAEKMAKKPFSNLINFPYIGHVPSLMEEYQIQIIREWLNK